MKETGKIMTVLGPIQPDQMGVTLPHEHVLVDFIGAEQVSPSRYKADHVMEIVIPYLEQVKKLGMQTLVECTPSYIGKDPALLRMISQSTGLHFLTNTGYYGSRDGLFLPTHAFIESASQLAQRWIREWSEGIEDTGIRPGFIKTAVNPKGPLSAMDRKLIQAAALTHSETGLTIVCHTKDGPVFEILEELIRLGVDPSAFIWVHAGGNPDARCHVAAAKMGAWVEFDWVKVPVDEDVALVSSMKSAGVLDRVLLSHDAGWFDPGKENGGAADYKPYSPLFEHLLPALGQTGFTESEIDLLTVLNPANAFTIGVKAYNPG